MTNVDRWLLAMLALVLFASVRIEAAEVSQDHVAQVKRAQALFKEHVRPLLVKHCLDCHGGKTTKADFDISSQKLLLGSGTIEKTAADSRLYQLIRHEEEPHMPFKKAKLAEAEIEHIRQWIELGAAYDKPLLEKSAIEAAPEMKVTDEDRKFWSFEPLAKVAAPDVKDKSWVATPIDQFVLAALEKENLRPNAKTDRRTLIRRAYFDLIGLPPTPEEIDAFVADTDPQAYENLLDRLLASDHYGERWARHWMDIARFAESFGYEQDYDRPNAYHYRDFLIRSLNDDLSYDQFLKWQIAGDEFAPDNSLALMATGFLGGGAFPTQLTETEFETSRYEELDDMLRTTFESFLGLTIGCARCHDHKFDPFPTADYYRLAATFSTTIRAEVELPVGEDKKNIKVQVTGEGIPHMKHHADGRGFPHFYKDTYHLKRGDVTQKASVAEPGFLQVLMRDGRETAAWKVSPPEGWTKTSYRRTSLATWMTDAEHGAGALAARVIVNRMWQHHFGQGIVATPSDFGFQGDRPSHPELLDYLANDLIAGGWKLKRLHKLMMLSSVYTQSSDFDESRAAIDRSNRYLWRRTPRRLEGEVIRDAMLKTSAVLDTRMFGPGSLDVNMRRRSVYFFIKRSKLIPMMMLFDWPEHLVGIGARSSTTIAPQALMFLNSNQTRAYAEALAKRLDKSPEVAVDQAYQLLFGRSATPDEQMLSGRFIAAQAASYRQTDAADKQADHKALVDYCHSLYGLNEFVYVD